MEPYEGFPSAFAPRRASLPRLIYSGWGEAKSVECCVSVTADKASGRLARLSIRSPNAVRTKSDTPASAVTVMSVVELSIVLAESLCGTGAKWVV